MSLIAELSFSLSLNPVSLGIIKTFLSLFLLELIVKNIKENFLILCIHHDKGANNPTFKLVCLHYLETLELKKIIM